MYSSRPVLVYGESALDVEPKRMKPPQHALGDGVLPTTHATPLLRGR